MANLQQFLNGIGPQKILELVGPMLGEPHQPQHPSIYIDGGGRWISKSNPNQLPIFKVGDGDSGANLDQLLSQEKDHSDLAFVLRALPQSCEHLEMHGFQGGRLDHLLCNIGEIHAFLKLHHTFTKVFLRGAHELVIGFSSGTFSWSINGTFSLLSLEPCMVQISGDCKYQLSEPWPLQSLSSHGLSNVGFGQVTVKGSGPLFLIAPC